MQMLQKLGLLDSLLEKSASGASKDPGVFCLRDLNCKDILRTKFSTPAGLPIPTMRAARNILRRALIESLAADDHIFQGMSCVGATKLENGRIKVQLSKGHTGECDVLIAADGANTYACIRSRPNAGRDSGAWETISEPFQSIVHAIDVSTLAVIDAMDKKPFSHTRSLQDKGVIFIGDANHAVSPFAGSGANMALVDGWNLAEQFCKCEELNGLRKHFTPSGLMPPTRKQIKISSDNIFVFIKDCVKRHWASSRVSGKGPVSTSKFLYCKDPEDAEILEAT
ncbi:hypothetical protein B0O99DRAFT_725323 [Bisporella sp. PMI_857]|nr:hypothetical protein B0O99DRAFT_725323 [Bisporella sp. PMI_857]